MLLLLLLAVAACGGEEQAAAPGPPATPQDGVVNVRAFEWGFTPDAIALQRGEEVRIVLENEGQVLHNLKVDDIDAEVIESRGTGPLEGDEGELFVGAAAGEQGTLAFVPQEQGSFVFYCDIRGHRQLGMEGALTVE